MARLNHRVISSKKGEVIHLIETEKFTFAFEPVPGFRSLAIGFWFPIGSRYEPESNRGISHFIEHLIFKGTQKYDAHKISEIFDSLGAKVNAFTGKEMTCYHIHLLSDNAKKAISLLVEMLKEPAFREKDIESERQVILQEIAMYEDSPDEQVHDFFAEAVFKGTNLGKPIIGSNETVSSIKKQDILNFYRNYYQKNRFYITAAGDVNPEIILTMAENLNGNKEDRVHLQDESFEENQNHKLVKKETSQTHICIGYRIFGAGNPDRFAMAVLDSILGGMMSSRLFREIREKRGLSYSTFSYSTYYRDAGYICAYSGVAHENIYKVARLTLREFQKLTEKKVSKKELEKAKENVKSSLVLAGESMKARMNFLGKSLLSKEEILPFSEIIERVNQVDSEDILRLAQTYFSRRPAISVIGKFDEEKLLKIFES